MQAGHRGYTHVVRSSPPWWWNPPGIDEDEWREWLYAVRGMEPVERAHRLASAVASRLCPHEPILVVRCREHDSLIATVAATTHGALWRSRITGAWGGPVISQAALLEFNAFTPVLRAWCSRDGATTTFEPSRILELVTAARQAACPLTVTDQDCTTRRHG